MHVQACVRILAEKQERMQEPENSPAERAEPLYPHCVTSEARKLDVTWHRSAKRLSEFFNIHLIV